MSEEGLKKKYKWMSVVILFVYAGFIFLLSGQAEEVFAASSGTNFGEISVIYAANADVPVSVLQVSGQTLTVSAEDAENHVKEQEQELLSDLPLEEIQDVLDKNADTRELSFQELVRRLIRAENNTDKWDFFQEIWKQAFSDMEEGKQLFVQILLLTAACAFLQNFINVFENSQISKTGFYLYFLLLMGLLIRSYLLVHGIIEGVLDQVIAFMEALLPAFCMTMIFCSQQVSAVGFYQLSLIIIYLIDRVLLYFIIPAIHIYVVLQMLNCMTGEKLVSRMTALLKRGLIWLMRLMLAGVTGMNVIERMIAPSVDNLKKMSVTQTISMIPGLGNTAQAVGNILFGSAAVIRNGIGTAAMVAMFFLVLGPLMKVLIFSGFYKIAGALAEPFSDKRICGCIDCVGDGAFLLFRALGTGVLLCVITIAVVVTATV